MSTPSGAQAGLSIAIPCLRFVARVATAAAPEGIVDAGSDIGADYSSAPNGFAHSGATSGVMVATTGTPASRKFSSARRM